MAKRKPPGRTDRSPWAEHVKNIDPEKLQYALLQDLKRAAMGAQESIVKEVKAQAASGDHDSTEWLLWASVMMLKITQQPSGELQNYLIEQLGALAEERAESFFVKPSRGRQKRARDGWFISELVFAAKQKKPDENITDVFVEIGEKLDIPAKTIERLYYSFKGNKKLVKKNL